MPTPPTAPFILPPMGGILDRYLIAGFARIFAISLLAITALYLIVDLSDRADNFLKSGASLGSSLQYFLYRLPLFISRVFGFATLFSVFLTVGMLSRHQEITAMRAAGLSLHRLSLPLLLVSLAISLLTFSWNESLLPVFSRKAQHIYKTEVKKKQPQNLVGSKEIWIHGNGVFISAADFDSKQNILRGLIIYLMNRDFSLKGLIEVPWARWNGAYWEANGSTEWLFLANGKMTQRPAANPLPISETPEDFMVFAREPEEFSFFELKRQIEELREKGIDPSEYEVDLQIKLAVPLVSPLMAFLAIPFALRHGPAGGMALSFVLTMLIGFGYWSMLAFSVSLGHSGALPPWIAAWIPNFTLALVGLFFFTGEE
ncbi:MAG: LPS export ABC transporter permease LptG [Candidatus Binatia bacterium]